MDFSLVLAIAALVIGPLSGIIIALVANHRAKKDTASSFNIQERTVSVAAKDADTHYFQAIIDGFVDQIRLSNERAEKLEAQINGLESRINAKEAREALMLNHITTLENLIPIPPGAPPRKF